MVSETSWLSVAEGDAVLLVWVEDMSNNDIKNGIWGQYQFYKDLI